MSSDPLTETTGRPFPRRWQALALLALAQFMLILDITVVAVAMPSMGLDLEMGREALTWVMSAYTLAFGGLMLLAGRAADGFGPRPLVFAGLALFSASSLLVGLADSGGEVIVGRTLQGLGAALMSPAALSIVVRLFDGDERNRALGIWSALGGVGAAAGVLVGGLLTAGPGWPWVFWVNVPVGALLLLGLHLVLPPLPPWSGRAALDWYGAILVTGATLALTYAFIASKDLEVVPTIALLTLSLLLYLSFWARLRRADQPLVDPALLARRPVQLGAVLIFVATALMVAVFFLGTFYLQHVRGHDALTTGLLFLPIAVATMAGAQVAGRTLGRMGPRGLALLGLGIAAAGFFLPTLSLTTVSATVSTSVAAFGLGILFVVSAASALSRVAAHVAGTASGVLSTCHELGSSVGAAVVSSIVAVTFISGDPEGFRRGYLVAAAIAVVAALAVGMLAPPSVEYAEASDADPSGIRP